VDRVEAARQTEHRHLHRELVTWVDEDGMLVIRGRLTPEVGAVVQQALEAAADRLFRESAQAPRGATVTEEVTAAQRRADALGCIAERALAADLDRATTGDRYQVVLHVDAAALRSSNDRTSGTIRTARTAALKPLWSSAPARCAFPPKRRSGSHAMPRSS
jgi:hypothetical protein